MKAKQYIINGITKTAKEWAQEVGIDERTMRDRLNRNLSPEELLRPKGMWKPKANFNEHYFDIIDDEHKAYWLGFIWSDGYLGIRNRENRYTEYNLKLSLVEDDYKHLEKFNNDVDGHYKVHFYDFSNKSFKTDKKEARLFITNQYLGKTLSQKYGMIPHRTDCNKVLEAVPDELMRHFIRGILDADGSLSYYICTENNCLTEKLVVSIGSNFEIVQYVQQYLISNNIVDDYDRKLYKRHEDRDGDYIELKLFGINQAMRVLRYLYDNSTIYLDRKYDKLQNIIKQHNEFIQNKIVKEN